MTDRDYQEYTKALNEIEQQIDTVVHEGLNGLQAARVWRMASSCSSAGARRTRAMAL